MDILRVNWRRYSIAVCMTRICRARNVMHFVAQAQRFARSADCYAIPLGLAFGESCFWGIGGFRDKFQLKWRFWWMGVWVERTEIILNVWRGANFV